MKELNYVEVQEVNGGVTDGGCIPTPFQIIFIR